MDVFEPVKIVSLDEKWNYFFGYDDDWKKKEK